MPQQSENTLSVDLRAEFRLRDDVIHLNHAAVGPWPSRTVEAIRLFAEENASQGSLNYLQWLEMENSLRERLARLINAESKDDIALVKNTSEALSMVAYGLEWQAGDNIVISNQEFPSNRIVWESLKRFGVEIRQVDLGAETTPEESLLVAIDDKTRLLAISSIQYATGFRMDLDRLGTFCRSEGILFCVDAIQSIGAVRFDAQSCQADFVMADGHKWMLGPEGLGLFYCRPEIRDALRLNEYGWHMVEHYMDFNRKEWEPAHSARRFECGSPNMLGAVALNASLSLIEEVGIANIERMVTEKAAYLMALINRHDHLDLITLPEEGRYGGIVTFAPNNVPVEQAFEHLQRSGILCAMRGGGIRLSPHFHTGTAHLDRAVAAVPHAFG